MPSRLTRVLLITTLIGFYLGSVCTDASAITINEEREIATEFLKVLRQQYQFVEDPLINDYVQHVGEKILAHVPTQPFEFKFYILKEDVYNAFAIPAGYIFINSGLLMALDREDELAGILSHEIGHVVCRHVSQRIEQSKKINLATMAGVIAGIFLGAASGNADVAQGLVLGSAAAGQAAALGYSRDDEMQADQLGIGYLVESGYSVHSLLDVLQKIRSRDWVGSAIPDYLSTHPAVEQRMVNIDAWLASHPQSPSSKPADSRAKESFHRINVRLTALIGDPAATEQLFAKELKENADDADAAYGYGLLLSRLGRNEEAATWLRKALAHRAMDPVLLTELGRTYFQEGRYDEAQNLLSGIDALPGTHTEASYYLARTQSATGHYREAADLFESIIRDQRTYSDTYYYLGEAYDKLGDKGNSHYNLGLYYYYRGNQDLAFYHFNKARESIQDPQKIERLDALIKETRPKPKPPEQ